MKFYFCFIWLNIQNIFIYSYDILKEPAGALLSVDFTGKVGYLLDEIPIYSLKETKEFIQNSVNKDEWINRVKEQIYSTSIRQFSRKPKRQLTIPPEEVWQIKLNGEAYEDRIQGHDYIVRNYTFHSVVVGRADTLNASEPLLNKINGEYSNYFIIPADPEHIFQRYFAETLHYLLNCLKI